MEPNEAPAPGTRVMWVYGRRDYAEFGEIGVVVGHSPDGIDVQIDDEQPFHRYAYGAKSKRDGHARLVRFATGEVFPLVDVYLANAARMRRVAEDWDAAAAEVAP